MMGVCFLFIMALMEMHWNEDSKKDRVCVTLLLLFFPLVGNLIFVHLLAYTLQPCTVFC